MAINIEYVFPVLTGHLYVFFREISIQSLCPFINWASLVAQRVKCLPAMRETRVRSLSWEDSLEKEMQPTPVFLPGESHGRRSLVGYSPRSCKESDMTEQLHLIGLFILKLL